MMIEMTDSLAGLGYAQVTPEQLTTLVGRAVGSAVTLLSAEVHPVNYPAGSITTGALLRVAGTARSMDSKLLSWSVFVKQLQSARVWPLLHVIPGPHRETWVNGFPWRIEIDAYTSRLAELLPDGIRLPAVYDIIEIDDDRAAVWMEDVQPTAAPWTLARFERAARLLGILAGRRPLGTDVVFSASPESAVPGQSIRMYALGRVRIGVTMMLDDERRWQHPSLVAALAATGESTIRTELRQAMGRLDGWLDAMDRLPQTYVHGDASPQNLLVPTADEGSFVIIDFSFNSPHCVGFDLGQLLVGLAQGGEMDPSEVASIAQVIVPAYVEGLTSTGFAATPEQVRQGFNAALLVRSLFTALPLERLEEPESAELRDLLVRRVRLTRFLLDLVSAA